MEPSSTYSALSIPEDEIRILCLHPSTVRDSTIRVSTRPARLSTKPRYEALSYCWGTKWSSTLILQNGDLQLVTENLESALRHIRYLTSKVHLRIDAFCIDVDILSAPYRLRPRTSSRSFGMMISTSVRGQPSESSSVGLTGFEPGSFKSLFSVKQCVLSADVPKHSGAISKALLTSPTN